MEYALICLFRAVAYESKHPREGSSSLETISSSSRSPSIDLSLEERVFYESTNPNNEVVTSTSTNDYPDISLPPYPVLHSLSSDGESPIPLCDPEQFCSAIDLYAKDNVFDYFINDNHMENSFCLTNDTY